MSLEDHIEFLRARKETLEYYLAEVEMGERMTMIIKDQLKSINIRIKDFDK